MKLPVRQAASSAATSVWHPHNGYARRKGLRIFFFTASAGLFICYTIFMTKARQYKPTYIFKEINYKLLVILTFTPVLLLAALHLLFMYAVLPREDGLVNIGIASRIGTNNFYLNSADFIALSLSTIAAALILGLLITFMHRLKRSTKAVAVSLLVLNLVTIIYFGILLSSAFDALWGGWYSALGTVIAVILFILIASPILNSVQNKK